LAIGIGVPWRIRKWKDILIIRLRKAGAIGAVEILEKHIGIAEGVQKFSVRNVAIMSIEITYTWERLNETP